MKEAEKKVTKLTAELTAARLGQVLVPPRLCSVLSVGGRANTAMLEPDRQQLAACIAGAQLSCHCKPRLGHLNTFREARCILVAFVYSPCQYADAAIHPYMLRGLYPRFFQTVDQMRKLEAGIAFDTKGRHVVLVGNPAILLASTNLHL